MSSILNRVCDRLLLKNLPDTINLGEKCWVKDQKHPGTYILKPSERELKQRVRDAAMQFLIEVSRYHEYMKNYGPETIDDTFIMKRFMKVV